MHQHRFDRRQFLSLLAGGAALGLAARTAPLQAFSPQPAWPLIDPFLRQFVANNPIPSAMICVGHQQGAPQFFNHGTMAIGDDRAVGPDTLWRLFSMTKPVTGMAAMLLVEDGAMALDQPIADFLPAFADVRVLTDPENSMDSRPAARSITVRNLLTHTAGLGYGIITTGPLLAEYQRLGLDAGVFMRRPATETAHIPQSLEAFADRLATLPLIADPGTRWSYSVSLDLLGRVIEVASGQSFDAFLQQRIFGPLGMDDTFFQVPSGKIDRLVDCYVLQEGAATLVDPAANSVYADPPFYPYGGSGLVSSARDYDRFLAMLLGEGAAGDVRIMETETARLGMSNLMPEGATIAGTWGAPAFGAGGRVGRPPGGSEFSTFGWGGAAGTVAAIDRTNGLRFAGYIQILQADSLEFREAAARSIYGSMMMQAAG